MHRVTQEKSVDRLSSFLPASHQYVLSWGKTLATWLVVGNAAALVFVLNLFASSNTRISPEALQLPAILFATGIILAFSGSFAIYGSNLWSFSSALKNISALDTVFEYQKRIVESEASGNELPNDHHLKAELQEALSISEQYNAKTKWFHWLFLLSLTLFLLSAVCFAAGVLVPILLP